MGRFVEVRQARLAEEKLVDRQRLPSIFGEKLRTSVQEVADQTLRVRLESSVVRAQRDKENAVFVQKGAIAGAKRGPLVEGRRDMHHTNASKPG